MKIKFLISGMSVLFFVLTASTAMACNCGKKSGTGQPSACSCGASCNENACTDAPVSPSQSGTNQGIKAAEEMTVDVGNKICPVSGKPIGSMGDGVMYKYAGKIYHLCCAGCIDQFKMQPEYFISKIETIEKIDSK